jgi:hypothetical protein
MTAGVFRGLVEPITAEELLDQAVTKPCLLCGRLWETVTAAWDFKSERYVMELGLKRRPSELRVVRDAAMML